MDVSKIIDYARQEARIMVLYLVGSYDTPYQTPLSDVDFAIISKHRLKFDDQVEILGRFTGMLKTDNVDIIFLPGAGVRVQHKVISQGRLLYCRDETFLTDFVERTIKLSGDFEPFLTRFYRDYDARLREEYKHDRA